MAKLFQRKVFTALGIAGALFCALRIAVADDMDSRFQRIATGLTKAGTVAIMGRQPDAETSTKMLGFTYEKLRWNDAGRAFVVRFIGSPHIDGRVISTKTCSGAVDC
jgi:hypothetical protein